MSEIGSLELTAGVAVVSVALAAFSSFCPPLDKLVNDTDGENRAGVQFGQNAAGIATLSVGTVLSVATRSPMPFIFSVGIAGLLMFVYEFAERKGM